MPEAIRKVNVIGHLHPDTDSICAAISYAYLKNQIDEPIYEARRAGALNRETAFVLKHFGFEEPPLITSVTPQIKDIVVQKQPGIDAEMSLFAAWNMMQDTKVDTLCITDEDKHLEGLIAVKDVANANMDIFDTAMLSEAQTSYKNIIETLNGTLLLGDPNGRVTKGNVRVGTTPEMMEDTIKAGDIVLPYDTFAAARLIGMSVPVRAKMLRKGILQFSVNTSVDDARKIMAKSRHRFFPVIDEDGSYFGLVSSPNLINIKRKHVILVDHSERSQAVDGLDQAEIMEILDHHRIGTIETNAPVYYRAEPVGCTCTIIYSAYAEAGVEIPPKIAGLMLSAILSDTLTFRSPTCTAKDRHAAEELAKICGEDIETYADSMFEAGADLTGRTAEEVFHQDFKVFSRGNAKFGVGQGSYMTKNSRVAAENLVRPFLAEAAKAEELPMIFYMFTDVKSQSTDLMIYGNGAEDVVAQAFDVTPKDGMALLKGVVSRKKQIIPPIMATLQKIDEDD